MLTLSAGPAHHTCDGVSRRDSRRVGTLGTLGLTLPRLLQADSARGAGGRGPRR